MAATGGSWDRAFAKARKAQDVFGLVCLGAFGVALALAVWAVLRAGFTHLSDDDYARTVIAQEWVASVRGLTFLHELPGFRAHRWARIVDPSGTSWLPFPFWVTGLGMTLLGRSIAVARGVQMVLLAGSTALLGRSLRQARFGRIATACILALGFANPYALWLGASQTPDAWVGVLGATALLSLVQPKPDRLAAFALLAAAASRYEMWPVALVFAARYARGPLRGRALVPLLAPAAWMAWNAVAHGSPLHFFARVSAYRQSVAGLSLPLRAAYVPAAYVELFEVGMGLVVAAGVLTVVAVAPLRRRWAPVLVGMGALLGFLFVGSLGDGAPTHHGARAQLSLLWVGTALLWVATGELMQRVQIAWGSKAGAIGISAMLFGGILWSADLYERVRQNPAGGEAARDEQVARGEGLQPERPEGFGVRSCRYEHLALLAGYGAPERVRVLGPTSPQDQSCPTIVP